LFGDGNYDTTSHITTLATCSPTTRGPPPRKKGRQGKLDQSHESSHLDFLRIVAAAVPTQTLNSRSKGKQNDSPGQSASKLLVSILFKEHGWTATGRGLFLSLPATVA
jgi:hypothetical protein